MTMATKRVADHWRALLVVQVMTWLVTLPDDVMSSVCDGICECYQSDGDYSVHCTSKGLDSIPRDMPINVTNLDLSVNHFPFLASDGFVKPLDYLQRLDLRQSGIESLELGVFDGMPNLLELALEQNKLRQLPLGIFTQLKMLTILSLNNNELIVLENRLFEGLDLLHLNLYDNGNLIDVQEDLFLNARVETLGLDRCALRDLPMEMFHPLKESLRTLFWSHTIHPLEINDDLFTGLRLDLLRLADNGITNLTFLNTTTTAIHLDISQNQLRSFNFALYTGLRNTESLVLSSNEISYLEQNGPVSMSALRELELKDNKLERLSADIFTVFENLTRLDISQNNLKTLADSMYLVFVGLAYLNVDSNPFNCDCSMQWFVRWSRVQKRVVIFGENCAAHPYAADMMSDCTAPIILRLTEQTLPQGVTLICEAEGSPSLNLTWRIHFTDNTTDYHLHQAKVMQTNGSVHRHKSTIYVDSFLYSNCCFSADCIASNGYGMDEEMYSRCGHSHASRRTAQFYPIDHLKPLLGLVLGLTLVVVLAVIATRYIRTKGLHWKRWSFNKDKPYNSDRTLITEECEQECEPEGEDDGEHMSVESV